MPHFPPEWLEELKSKADIVSILSKFINLQRKGNKYWACCPFHNEKTASFVVNPDEQYYHCYGCKKSGNIITFLMEHEMMSFPDAIAYLAKELNMEIPENDDPKAKELKLKKDKIFAINKAAARIFYANLSNPAAKPALDYLDKRKIEPETRIKFGLGYCLGGFSLQKALLSQGFSKETMLMASLITHNGKDFFEERFIVPIIDKDGRILGFGGRLLDPNAKKDKYKNSTGTLAFDKRNVLFNVNLFKKSQITDKHTSVIITEGYMDVISLYQAGIHNVVASMGTALTPEHAQYIKNTLKVNKVYTCFDGDTAGQKATWSSIDTLTRFGLDVFVISLEGVMNRTGDKTIKDPDDCIKEYGAEGFLKLVKNALPGTEYKIRTVAKNYDITTVVGKEKFVLETIPILAELGPVSRDAYAKLISEISGLSKDSIISQVAQFNNGEKIAKPTMVKEQPSKEISNSNVKMSRFVLASMLDLKSYVLLDDLKEDIFDNDLHKKVYQYIVGRISKREKPIKGDLYYLDETGKDEIGAILSSIEQVPVDRQSDYYSACMTKLTKEVRQDKINRLLEEIKTAELEKQTALKQELLKLLSSK